MLAIFYTGDVRHNQQLARKNHEKLFHRLQEILSINVYQFTKDSLNRGICPYESDHPDNLYRRGRGGAIQVWDFINAVQRTTEPFVMRLRTDLWFTDSSINCICYEIQEILAGNTDIAYFGSDWINDNAGLVNKRLPVDIGIDGVVQDFVVVANRKKLKSFEQVLETIDNINPNKQRSGNKSFRFIVPTIIVGEQRQQNAIVFRTLCQIWLIRKTYEQYPDDDIVCRDYIQSYIADDKTKVNKKNLADIHPMQSAVNWWRISPPRNWPLKNITIGDWCKWQLE